MVKEKSTRKSAAMTSLLPDSFLGAGERGTIDNGTDRANPEAVDAGERVPIQSTRPKEKKRQWTKSAGTEARDPKRQSPACTQGTSLYGGPVISPELMAAIKQSPREEMITFCNNSQLLENPNQQGNQPAGSSPVINT